MNSEPKYAEFIQSLRDSISSQTFVKLSMGNYRGTEPTLKNIIIRKIVIRSEDKLSFTYRHKTRDIVKNFTISEGINQVENALNEGFHVATLFTTAFDLIIEKKKTGFLLRKTKPVHSEVPEPAHDRPKSRLIGAANNTYLHDLKITDENGKVLAAGQDKYRQINKYIEILSVHLKELPARNPLRVVDMGSGKGYLTFSLYDYLVSTLHLQAEVTGVEFRPELVELCNRISQKSGFQHLKFAQGTIEGYSAGEIDVLIALHACDTATDEALYKGITAGAALIVVAPCCHKQIRREMEAHAAQNDLAFLTRHGIFLERQAEMVTDSIRALILEAFGYKTKVFEFISDAHTPKNIMIVATRSQGGNADHSEQLNKIREAKAYFGIGYHHLEKLLNI